MTSVKRQGKGLELIQNDVSVGPDVSKDAGQGSAVYSE